MLGRQDPDLRFLAVCADRTNLEAARMETAEQLLNSQRIPDDHFSNATASAGKPTVWDPYEFVDSVLDGKTGGGACVGNDGQLYYLEGRCASRPRPAWGCEALFLHLRSGAV